VSIPEVKKNGMVIFGNYIVIDHGNGEFSHLGHLKPGSAKVAVGDKVRAGQRSRRSALRARRCSRICITNWPRAPERKARVCRRSS
jgi:hypothetical protein